MNEQKGKNNVLWSKLPRVKINCPGHKNLCTFRSRWKGLFPSKGITLHKHKKWADVLLVGGKLNVFEWQGVTFYYGAVSSMEGILSVWQYMESNLSNSKTAAMIYQWRMAQKVNLNLRPPGVF
jgi:hypothetical protein